jgi:hypothetical protein
MSIFTRPLRAAIRWTLDWPVESQLAARRNAMVACTSLAQRRAEQLEVERFLTAAQTAAEVAATAAQR